MKYKSDKPYPIPRVEGKNIDYAKLLLKNYAGDISEETAIHLYLFQSLVLNNKTEFANIMEHIAEVEMHHLKLLGETIQLLGMRPVYGVTSEVNSFKPWNSINVNYSTDLKKILSINIQSEQYAINNYQYHYSIIKDKYIRELLFRIIEDEKIHLNIFLDLYQKWFGF